MNLEAFCWHEDVSHIGSRPELLHPFLYEGYIYATNGRVLIRVPEGSVHGQYKPFLTLSRMAAVIEPLEHRKAVRGYPFPSTLPEQATKKCDECDGGGHVETCPTCKGTGVEDCECLDCGNHHERPCTNPNCTEGRVAGPDGSHTCMNCYGKGRVPIPEGVWVGGALLCLTYLRVIHENATNPRLYPVDTYTPVVFTAVDCEGLIMPMRTGQGDGRTKVLDISWPKGSMDEQGQAQDPAQQAS